MIWAWFDIVKRDIQSVYFTHSGVFLWDKGGRQTISASPCKFLFVSSLIFAKTDVATVCLFRHSIKEPKLRIESTIIKSVQNPTYIKIR